MKLRNDIAHAKKLPGGTKESLLECHKAMQQVRLLFQLELLDLLGFSSEWIKHRANSLPARRFLKRTSQ